MAQIGMYCLIGIVLAVVLNCLLVMWPETPEPFCPIEQRSYRAKKRRGPSKTVRAVVWCLNVLSLVLAVFVGAGHLRTAIEDGFRSAVDRPYDGPVQLLLGILVIDLALSVWCIYCVFLREKHGELQDKLVVDEEAIDLGEGFSSPVRQNNPFFAYDLSPRATRSRSFQGEIPNEWTIKPWTESSSKVKDPKWRPINGGRILPDKGSLRIPTFSTLDYAKRGKQIFKRGRRWPLVIAQPSLPTLPEEQSESDKESRSSLSEEDLNMLLEQTVQDGLK